MHTSRDYTSNLLNSNIGYNIPLFKEIYFYKKRRKPRNHYWMNIYIAKIFVYILRGVLDIDINMQHFNKR